MEHKGKYILLVLFSLFLLPCPFAQKPHDTLTLPEFELRSGFIHDKSGFKRIKLDSVMMTPLRSTDLSTLLYNHSTVFIKSYGNNNLATPSFRGTAAHHTQVEWNGISLNSPMLGQTDFSQIPVSQFDAVEILYGAAGLTNTSGAFGGVVNLQTNPDWDNTINITAAQTAGSFGYLNTNAGISTGNQKIQSHTRFNYSSVINNFPYTDNNGERVRQTNASGVQWGLSQEIFARVLNNGILTGKIWYTDSDRNLPPVVSNPDTAHREKISSEALRAVIEFRMARKQWNLQLRSAMIDDYMNYVNDSLGLDAHHHYYSSVNRLRFGYTGIKDLTIKPGLDINLDWVISDGYDGIKNRTTIGLFADIRYEPHPAVDLSLILREDLIDGKSTPFIPALAIDYTPFRHTDLAFNLNLARNYRYPTLNDLYWDVFGNPDLLPETGYLGEAGVRYGLIPEKRKLMVEASLSGYLSLIFDYIEWTPVAGVYRPDNVTEVFSRGIETGIKLKWQVRKLTMSIDNNYHFCRSTYQKTGSPNDKRLGMQLRYVPVHTLNSTAGAEYFGFYLQYNITWNSRRYTDNANDHFMPGYNLSNVFFGKRFHLKNFIISLQLQINNLFDLDYQSVTNYAMPGRNYAGIITFNFHKNR